MKLYKLFLILSFILFSTNNIFAQNEMKARIEFEDAETAFQNKDFKSALSHLEKAETALGKWTAKISYLKIIATDKVIEYEEWNEELKKLKQEVTAYMKYANTNPENIDMERVREIYVVEEKVNQIQKWKDNEIQWKKYDEIEKKWEADSDYISAKKEYDKEVMQDRLEYDSGNFDLALTLFQKAASKGNPAAMYMAGYIYWFEKGTSFENEALKYFDQAIEKGHAGAMRMKGKFFRHKNDKQKAREWYDLAVEKGGDADAISGIADDVENAEELKWRIKAAQRDKTGIQMHFLAEHYQEKLGDNDKAMYWHELAAEKGQRFSMYELGERYLNGKEVSKNTGKAFYWHEKAANQYHYGSMYQTAEMYRKGIGTIKNNEKAYFWYKKAINGSWSERKVIIGKFFLELNKYEEALDLLKTAANTEQNNQEAMELLGDIYYNGNPAAEKKYEEAIKWYLLAYKNKDQKPKSSFYKERRTMNVAALKEKIAKMYEEGLGVEKDKKMAKEWRSK